MSTVIARYVASTPERTASETWKRIVSLLAGGGATDARSELERVAGIAGCAISAETLAQDPFVVWGGGLRVRVYCVFDDAAIQSDGVNEDPLPRSCTEGEWRLSIPLPEEDLAWASAELKRMSTRTSARAAGDEVEEDGRSEGSDSSVGRKAGGTINTEEFFRT